MKEKIGNITLILLGVGVLIYLLLSSIMDLINTEDLHTVTLDGAFEVLQLEHSIYGLIPIGTDYYYVGINEDTYDAYLIKSSKKWLNNNFSYDNKALDSNGVQITGLAKEISDYQTSRELGTRLAQLEGVNYPLGALYCLNLEYKLTAVLKLIDVALLITLVITGVYIFKNKNDVKPLYLKLWLVGMIISLVLLIGFMK